MKNFDNVRFSPSLELIYVNGETEAQTLVDYDIEAETTYSIMCWDSVIHLVRHSGADNFTVLRTMGTEFKPEQEYLITKPIV